MIENTSEQKAIYKKWEKANHLILMIMRRSISDSIFDAIPDNSNTKQFFDVIRKRYVESDKAKAKELMDKLINIRYDGTDSVRDYIKQLESIASQLKSLDILSLMLLLFNRPLILFLHNLVSLKILIMHREINWL